MATKKTSKISAEAIYLEDHMQKSAYNVASLRTTTLLKEMATKKGSKTSAEAMYLEDHMQKSADNVASLRTTQDDLFDLIITIGQKQFHCHRVILKFASPYFKNLVRSNNNIYISGVAPEVFDNILDFVYKGVIILSNDNVEAVLTAANTFQMNDLQRICVKFMQSKLTPQNCLEFWNAAESVGERGIQDQALDFLFENDIDNIIAMSGFTKLSQNLIKEILRSESIKVKTEVETCELLLSWMDAQTSAGQEIQPETLLPYIRWPTVSVEYIRAKLLTNTIFTINPACIAFLTKVINFHMSGYQFEGLLTFPRASIGLEKCLVIVGQNDGTKVTSDVQRISLQRRYTISSLPNIPTKLENELRACVHHSSALYVTGAGDKMNEIWRWDQVSAWIRCSDMVTGRHGHSVALTGSALYILGGYNDISGTVLDSVEKYDIMTNRCTPAGKLKHAVHSSNANCVTYKNNIYLFGGNDSTLNRVDYIQLYDTTKEKCTLLLQCMPTARGFMRALPWDTFVILLNRVACYIFDLRTRTWQERPQYKLPGAHVGCCVENEMIFIAGGGIDHTDSSGEVTWNTSDGVHSVPVSDIIHDKPANWTQHANLLKPNLVQNYAVMMLPPN